MAVEEQAREYTEVEYQAALEREYIKAFEEPYWTPIQVLAWICFRNSAAAGFFKSTLQPELVKINERTYVMMEFPKRSFLDICCTGAYKKHIEEVDFIDPREGEQSLYAALKAGKLAVSAREPSSSGLVTVSNAEWFDLEIDFENNTVPKNHINPRFTGLRAKKSDVLEVWPASDNLSHIPTKGRPNKTQSLVELYNSWLQTGKLSGDWGDDLKSLISSLGIGVSLKAAKNVIKKSCYDSKQPIPSQKSKLPS